MSDVRDGQPELRVADVGQEGSAVDQLTPGTISDQKVFVETPNEHKAKTPPPAPAPMSTNDLEDVSVTHQTPDEHKPKTPPPAAPMSTNDLEDVSGRGAVDRRGSYASDDGGDDDVEESRGSEDSLAAEGISMEKQDVETREKQAGLADTDADSDIVGGAKGNTQAGEVRGRGRGYSVVGGAGSGGGASGGERRVSSNSGLSDGKFQDIEEVSDRSVVPEKANAGGVAGKDSSDGSGGQDLEGPDDDDANQGLPFVAPITLEVGQVLFAPAPPPASTAMPALKSRSRDDEQEEKEKQGAAEAVKPTDVVEDDNGEKFFDAVQDEGRMSDEEGRARSRTGTSQFADNTGDADDEHVSSVSEGENEEEEEEEEEGEENSQGGRGGGYGYRHRHGNTEDNDYDHDLAEDETFPLRTYGAGIFRQDVTTVTTDPFLDRLAERRHRLSSGDVLSTSSAGMDDGASSVVSDVYSPRFQQHQRQHPHHYPDNNNNNNNMHSEAEERAAQSYNRFKASMPKFSSKAYSFGKKILPHHQLNPTPGSGTAANSAAHTASSSPHLDHSSSSSLLVSKSHSANKDAGDNGSYYSNANGEHEAERPPEGREVRGTTYDTDLKVDRSEGYFLDNYADVCTWRLPVRETPRLDIERALDLSLDDVLLCDTLTDTLDGRLDDRFGDKSGDMFGDKSSEKFDDTLEKIDPDETASEAKLQGQDLDKEEIWEEGEEMERTMEGAGRTISFTRATGKQTRRPRTRKTRP
ncbi:hypothetical protein EGW08_018683 [Elysia chlorotica]|uniref:Uncharacterized protein n=1 Tax=Elysia chlorotica TaxID=188477 RepID=A0A433SWC1_ELYCH|nr:hypothetical protein EGW08_018683 [Elysia chlorotica]